MLHLHILLWLIGCSTAAHMKDLLHSDKFREKVSCYIDENINGDVRGTSSEEFDIPSCNSELPYSRPYDPSSNNYDNSVSKMEFLLAKNLQKHKCGLGCIKVMKGQVICKRCAPFPVSKLSWIDAEGKWGPQ
jgi:hypothetical protein